MTQLMNLKDILDILDDDQKIENYFAEVYGSMPISLDSSMSAGELADHLAVLTASYSFITSLISKCDHLSEIIEEVIEQYSAHERNKKMTGYKAVKTAKDKEDSIRFSTIRELTLCGTTFKSIQLQDLFWLNRRTDSLRGYLKGISCTIDKSIEAGRTILSFQKEELKNLGVS